MDFRGKLQQFMFGRYGSDTLNQFLTILLILLLILYPITQWYVLSLLSTAICVWCCFRMLSRNHAARSAENQKFLQLTAPIRAWFSRLRTQHTANVRIFSCPQCGQKLRVPKGRGKIEITCPKCSHNFTKRS